MSPPLEVILTHEHTDFDALASLLVASYLYPNALPVLPRQLNRNVASFLALYRNRFPFVTDKDVPRGHIERAIIVDTRAVNWVKGMDHNTLQVILDHHRDDGPPGANQTIRYEAVGANTTMLVEQLYESGIALSPLHATLFALGVHEDTGSLTYPSTTYRDARCLAWIMQPDHKVNLEALAHFLNHPLSDRQRALLQELIDASEFVDVAGHTVMIACAGAEGFNEELSALASRFRDFHETDAVFMVIDLGDVIQVIARSTTDDVNVGAVADALGGGGHPRAAAAPVRDRGLGTRGVRGRIVELLNQHSRAAITVRHIMSTGRPQSLSPDMTVAAAAELMRRYGHEGFPVLRRHPDGHDELLGALTRREADRALNHELGEQPVSRFMRAGQITVRPDTSITELRHKMIESNWGQIPVMDDQNQIIGIVTRTDLIKLWDEGALPQHHAAAYAEKLRASLSPVQHALLRLIGEEIDVLNYTVYVVGGFVRDLLMNGRLLDVAALDMDIVIEGNAIDFARRMQTLYGGRVVPHHRFNTAKWLLDDPDHPPATQRLLADLRFDDVDLHEMADDLPPHFDFVTARTEFYTAPTALPTVEDSNIKLDLHRRDFTINTLALCLNPDRWGELLDFYGGVNDLKQGVVRVLHSLSFVDDPTRILRAVRYEQRFGFTIDARTQELMQLAIGLLDRVTPARVRHELERILQEDAPERALARLDELGALGRIHPQLQVTARVEAGFSALRRDRAEGDADDPLVHEPIERLYWGILTFGLPTDAHRELVERLGLRGETQRLVRDLARIHAYQADLTAPNLPASQIVRLLDGLDDAALALVPIVLADAPALQQHVARYRRQLRHVTTELDGTSLLRLGVPRGPQIGEMLRALRTAKLDGHIADRAEEEIFVREHLVRNAQG